MFFLYQILLILLLAVSPIIIFFRILKNKEDKKGSWRNLAYLQKIERRVTLFGFMEQVWGNY